MEQIALIITAFGAGVLLRQFGVFEDGSAKYFNRFVIYISLPSLVLLKIHGISFDWRLAVPISMPWLHFALAAVFFITLGKLMNWSRATVGALVLTGGLGNTSFVGFPLLETFWGAEHLPTAILIDQLGTFLILALVGVPLAAYFGEERVGSSFTQRRQLIKATVFRVLKFPPFIALIFAFVLSPFTYPDWLTVTLDRLSLTLLPIALFSVGLQSKVSRHELREVRLPLAIGLGFKLALAPAMIALIYFGIVGAKDITTIVTVYMSAMAPMITAGIVATESGLNRPLANLMLGIGIPISLFTSTIWYYVLKVPTIN